MQCEHGPCTCETTEGLHHCSDQCAAHVESDEGVCLCGHSACDDSMRRA